MSLVARTLVAAPAALVALGLFAATSPPPEWVPLSSHVEDAEVDLGEEGQVEAVVTVRVQISRSHLADELRLVVEDTEARRSSKVFEAGEDEASALRLKDGPTFTRFIPSDCDEFDGDVGDDGELTSECTLHFDLVFKGRRNRQQPFTLTAAYGGYDVFLDDFAESLGVEVAFELVEPVGD